MNRAVALACWLVLAPVSAQGRDQSPGGSIEGIVEDQDGNPVAQVKVSVINRRTDQRVADGITDPEGKFSITDLPEGRYALVFFSPAYERAVVRSVDVKSGRAKRLDRPVRLEPVRQEAIINGAVFNQDGFLVPGAQVVVERIPIEDELIEPLKRQTRTNNSGEFAFRLPATVARYHLTASAKGYQSQSKTLDIGGAERRHISLQLEPEP